MQDREESNGVVDPFTQGFIRKSARQLVGKFGLTDSDREDIEQTFYVKLAKHLPCDDPEHPKWRALVAVTVTRCIASIVRDRHAEKRDYRRVCTIHVTVGEDEQGEVELGDTIAEHEGRSHRVCVPRDEQDCVDLAIDVATCIASLSDPKLREFCERTMYDSVSQGARGMGVARTTASSWIPKLRREFERQDMKEYL